MLDRMSNVLITFCIVSVVWHIILGLAPLIAWISLAVFLVIFVPIIPVTWFVYYRYNKIHVHAAKLGSNKCDPEESPKMIRWEFTNIKGDWDK